VNVNPLYTRLKMIANSTTMVGWNFTEGTEMEKDKELEEKKKEIFKAEKSWKKKNKYTPRGNAPYRFQKGNQVGVRFGYGQSREGGGRPKNPDSILKSMKYAAEEYGMSAYDISLEILKLGMDKNIDPKVRFNFLKEANLRIFGMPSSSVEEALQAINNRDKRTFDLSIPLLEATVQRDIHNIVKELIKQGKLDEVVRNIKNE